MKTLSEEASKVLSALHKSPTWTWLNNDRAQLFAVIAKFSEPALIPYLAWFMFSSSGKERRVATQITADLLAKMPIEDLPALDKRIRANWSLQGSEPKFSPVILGHLTDSGPHLRTTLSVASMHPNGYLREEVIRRLNVVTEGWELKFLLIRLNDWVPEVRARAKPAVLARLRDDCLEELFQSLPIVLVLEHRCRAEHREVLDQIDTLLQAPPGRTRLTAGLNHSDKGIRRKCWQLLSTSSEIGLGTLIDLASSSSDPIISAQTVQLLEAHVTAPKARAFLNHSVRSSFSPVRRLALRALATHFPDDTVGLLHELIFDPSTSVRATSRYHLGELSTQDFSRIYAEAIAKGLYGRRLAAIAGLAETGASADADLLLPFLADARAALRRTAVLALVRLTGEKYLDRIVGMLRDPAASVVKQAARSLRPYADFIGGSKLIQLFETAEQSPSWLGALSLIASLSKWDALLYLLRASRFPDENRTKLVEGLLVRWNQRFNLVPINPSSQTIGLIQDELDQRRQALPQERAKLSDPAWLHDLRFTLRSLANE